MKTCNIFPSVAHIPNELATFREQHAFRKQFTEHTNFGAVHCSALCIHGSTAFYTREQSTPTSENGRVPDNELGSSQLPPSPSFASDQPSTLQPTSYPSQATGIVSSEPPSIEGQQFGSTSRFQPTGVSSTGKSGIYDQEFHGYSGGVAFTQQSSTGYPTYQPTATSSGKPRIDLLGTTEYLIGGSFGVKPEGTGVGSPGLIDFSTQRPFEQPSTGYSGQSFSTEGQTEYSPSGIPPQQLTTKTTTQEGTTVEPGYQPARTFTPEIPISCGGKTYQPEVPGGQTSITTEASTSEGVTPEQPGQVPVITEETTVFEQIGLSTGFTPSIPRGFTTSPSSAAAETESMPRATAPPIEGISEGSGGSQTTVQLQETYTTPQVGLQEPVEHPPHIHAIDVQCGKEMMTINIEFNREFNGIIYSKGFYNMPECRYVQENSGQIKYTFTVNLNMCGTEFVNAFDTEGQSYLENVLVLQNEAGIQEQWDTVRAVRCLWEGNIKDTLSVIFSIGMLSQEIVTFSGDTAMAKLDVVLGRGPFGAPANGLVKIGENMTLVVSVKGDPGFDIQVKDCKAIDSTGGNTLQLSDENGCILKPKLFGAFQKTRDTGNTGASVIAFAHFNAFKFPDIMDLMIECNIELCKTDCGICENEDESIDPVLRRKRRDATNNSLGDGIFMGKHLRVVLPEDLINIQGKLYQTDDICVALHSLILSSAILLSLLLFTSLTSCFLWFQRGRYGGYVK